MKALSPPPAQTAPRLHGAFTLLIFMLLFLCSLHAVAAYKVELTAPDLLKDLLGEYLDLVRYQDREDLNPDQLNFMIATAPEQVQQLAATQGFFSPQTTVEVDRKADVPVVRITVEPGPRTTVTSLDLAVVGPAQQESPQQVEQVHKSWSLTVGEPFRQEEWTTSKQTGLRILQQRRYPTAHIASSQARIQANRHAADLAVTYDSGPLFTLGDLWISGAQRYPESIIHNVSPLHVGEEYDVERLLELQREIQRTPYYSNVVVNIEKDPANAQLAPVHVRVTEYPRQRIRGGAGYATDTGAHVQGRYTHYNVFNRAWIFDAQSTIEQRRQFGGLDLAMPPDRGAFVNSMHGSAERTTLEGVDLRTRRIGIQRARSTDTLDYAYTLQYYRDQLEQLNGAMLPPDIVVEPGIHEALVLGYARTHRDVDDPLFPRRGHVVSLQAGFALKGLFSDETFFRAYSRMRHYRPAGRRDLVILRAELGAVITKGGNAGVPASLLFRAGGTESVRGYGFQSIGNVRNGTVYPTRYLATGGVEYQHWFNESWGGAVFYDVGIATDRWSDRQLFHGVGIGVRWRSPVGPVNVDIGYGLEDNRIRPHLSLGVVF